MGCERAPQSSEDAHDYTVWGESLTLGSKPVSSPSTLYNLFVLENSPGLI